MQVKIISLENGRLEVQATNKEIYTNLLDSITYHIKASVQTCIIKEMRGPQIVGLMAFDPGFVACVNEDYARRFKDSINHHLMIQYGQKC